CSPCWILITRRRPRLRLFPYATLFRAGGAYGQPRAGSDRCGRADPVRPVVVGRGRTVGGGCGTVELARVAASAGGLVGDELHSRAGHVRRLDRKSTRLDSSHVKITYA